MGGGGVLAFGAGAPAGDHLGFGDIVPRVVAALPGVEFGAEDLQGLAVGGVVDEVVKFPGGVGGVVELFGATAGVGREPGLVACERRGGGAGPNFLHGRVAVAVGEMDFAFEVGVGVADVAVASVAHGADLVVALVVAVARGEEVGARGIIGAEERATV